MLLEHTQFLEGAGAEHGPAPKHGNCRLLSRINLMRLIKLCRHLLIKEATPTIVGIIPHPASQTLLAKLSIIIHCWFGYCY